MLEESLLAAGVPVSGPIEAAIRESVVPPVEFGTPAKAQPFTVHQFDDEGVVLLVGPQKSWTHLRWQWLEGVPAFLAGRSWMPLSANRNSEAAFGTFDGYFRKWVKRSVGVYVAVLLQHAGVLEIQSGTRVRVRLAPDWGRRALLS